MPDLDKASFLERLAEAEKSGDWESAHSDADQVLCEVLAALGYQDIVDAWKRVGKWYA